MWWPGLGLDYQLSFSWLVHFTFLSFKSSTETALAVAQLLSVSQTNAGGVRLWVYSLYSERCLNANELEEPIWWYFNIGMEMNCSYVSRNANNQTCHSINKPFNSIQQLSLLHGSRYSYNFFLCDQSVPCACSKPIQAAVVQELATATALHL